VRPIRLRAACRPPAAIADDARRLTDALVHLGRLEPDYVTVAPTPTPPTRPAPMAKKMVKKNAPPPTKPLDDKAAALTEATVARVLAARPAPEAAQEVPGVMQGKAPAKAGAVGAAFPVINLTPAALKKMMAPLIKNALSLGVAMAGQTVEQLIEDRADLLDDFVPDAVYEMLERIAHNLNHGNDYPHVSDHPYGSGTPAPSTPVGPKPTPPAPAA
jgi:hypothetical protein